MLLFPHRFDYSETDVCDEVERALLIIVCSEVLAHFDLKELKLVVLVRIDSLYLRAGGGEISLFSPLSHARQEVTLKSSFSGPSLICLSRRLMLVEMYSVPPFFRQ